MTPHNKYPRPCHNTVKIRAVKGENFGFSLYSIYLVPLGVEITPPGSIFCIYVIIFELRLDKTGETCGLFANCG